MPLLYPNHTASAGWKFNMQGYKYKKMEEICKLLPSDRITEAGTATQLRHSYHVAESLIALRIRGFTGIN
jgi:hypothetical protein